MKEELGMVEVVIEIDWAYKMTLEDPGWCRGKQ
jgi:hypothetical protein